MTTEQIAREIADRLRELAREDKSIEATFAELAAVNAAFAADAGVEQTPAGAAKGYDLCLKGAECFFRLAVVFALAEDELYRRGGDAGQ